MTEKSLTEVFNENYSEIKGKIALAAQKSGRNPEDITLLAVEGKCSYTVTFTSAEFAILEMHPTEEPKPVAAAAPADTAKAAPAVEQAPASAPADTTAAKPAPAACPQAAESAPADSTKKKDRIFYKVMEFTYGNFGEHSYYQKGYGRIRNLDDETGYEGGLTYYLRWYFYDGGAFSSDTSSIDLLHPSLSHSRTIALIPFR